MNSKDVKVDILADINNKMQLPMTVLDFLSKGKSVSDKQIKLGVKELYEANRLMKRLV